MTLRVVLMSDGFRRAAVLLASLQAVPVALAGGGWPAEWVQPVDGNWTDATRWSTHPAYPNTGSYSVTIAAAGAPYSVSLDSDITVRDARINAADATLEQSGGSFQLDHLGVGDGTGNFGTYRMSGGTLTLLQGNPFAGLGGLQIGATTSLVTDPLPRGGTGTFVQTGGTVHATQAMRVGYYWGSGTLLVQGTSTRFNSFPPQSPMSLARSSYVGLIGNGYAAFTDGAIGKFSGLSVGVNSGSGQLIVGSGATVDVNLLDIGTSPTVWAGPGFGTVAVSGAASRLNVGHGTLTIGDSTGGSALLHVQGGLLSADGAARTGIRRFGSLLVSGGVAELGGLTMTGGRLTVGGSGELRALQDMIVFDGGTVTVIGGRMHGSATLDLMNGTLLQSGGSLSLSQILVRPFSEVVLSGGSASFSLFSSTGSITQTGGTLDVTGDMYVSGQANISGGQLNARKLAVFNSGTFTLAAGAQRTIRAARLEFDGSGRLDLNDNRVIVDYTGPSELANVARAVQNGYGTGVWNGHGIRSSLAALDAALGVGYAEAANLFTAFPAIFGGQEVDSSSVLIRLTLRGDANLDGVVNLADFNRLAAGFGASFNAVWWQGDFNYDGRVNLSDFNLLAANFGLSASGPEATPSDWAALAAAVPEPGALGLAVTLSVSLAGTRRRGSGRRSERAERSASSRSS